MISNETLLEISVCSLTALNHMVDSVTSPVNLFPCPIIGGQEGCRPLTSNPLNFPFSLCIPTTPEMTRVTSILGVRNQTLKT